MTHITKFFALLLLVCFMFGCSPESEGRRAAKKLHDCEIVLAKELNKAYLTFIDKFKSYSFKTRVEARNHLANKTNKIYNKYQTRLDDADRYRKKMEDKYDSSGDNNKKEKYYDAFRDYQTHAKAAPEVDSWTSLEAIDRLISEIIPPRPDIEKIKNDVVGRSFRGRGQKIQSPDEVKHVRILETNSQDDEKIVMGAEMVFQRTGSEWEVNATITYILREDDWDWKLDTFKVREANPVITGRYTNYVVGQLRRAIEHNILLTNHGDVALEVGGICYPETVFGDIRRDLAKKWGPILVPAYGRKVVTSTDIYGRSVFLGYANIQYVELPY